MWVSGSPIPILSTLALHPPGHPEPECPGEAHILICRMHLKGPAAATVLRYGLQREYIILTRTLTQSTGPCHLSLLMVWIFTVDLQAMKHPEISEIG